jgi:hypothetical protein
MRASPSRVNYALGNSLVIEVRNLLAEDKVFKQ